MLFFTETLCLGLRNLMLHKLRSLLTVLGIIFGVSAVIMMVAIGEGNKIKVLADIRSLGAENIILRSRKPPESNQVTGGDNRQNVLFRYGLKRDDLRRIKETVAPIRRLVPLKTIATRVNQGAMRADANVMGTTPELVEVTAQRVARGRYLTAADMQTAASVAVLGSHVADQLFPLADPVGQTVRVERVMGGLLLEVVGVLAPLGDGAERGGALVGRNLDDDVHLPLTTANTRCGDKLLMLRSGSSTAEEVELTELVAQVPRQEQVPQVAEKIKLALEVKGPRDDVQAVIPVELLRQAESAQRNFNYLMTAIAAISLIVGGIGIMNIMLATVTERTREIGIRRAVGATRRHIVWQFLVETAALAGAGGLVGVALGLAVVGLLNLSLSRFPQVFHDLAHPVVTPWSVMLSFCVATAVGVVFGLYPAVRASRQDPILALRHD